MLKAEEQMKRPILFGEVLFDHFADGSRVLGGAPFNVAWHLQAFGARPVFVSSVGRDVEGEEVLAAMTGWGMDTAGVQRDAGHATGGVAVSIVDGEPRFEIYPERAYDFVDGGGLPVVADGALLYHGSLALRHAASRSAFEHLLEAGLPVFLDVNLRPPWWDPAVVVERLEGAHWVKLNHDEMKELESEGETLEERAHVFLQRHGLESVFLTKGKEGAVALGRDGGRFEVRPGAVKQVVDTVGAGDAFASVLIFGLLQEWPIPRTLERAQAFASSMVRVRGATVNDMAFYQSHLEAWGLTEKAVDQE